MDSPRAIGLLRHGLLREFMLLSRNAVKAFQGENL
jgi:hypothetical protein